jgi:hypothetical protein
LFLENLRGLALLLPDFWIERQLSIYFAFIGMKRTCRRCFPFCDRPVEAFRMNEYLILFLNNTIP